MKVELTTILYLVDKLNIANWLKLKKQLLLKYGSDWMEKVESKKKNVDAKVVEFVEFKVVMWNACHHAAEGEERP